MNRPADRPTANQAGLRQRLGRAALDESAGEPLDPAAARRCADMGECVLALGDADTAAAIARQVLRQRPRHERCAALLVAAEDAAGRRPEAIAALDAHAAAFRDPAAARARRARLTSPAGEAGPAGWIGRIGQARRAGGPAAACDMARAALDHGPGKAALMREIAAAHVAAGRAHDLAVLPEGGAQGLGPARRRAWRRLAIALREAGRPDIAERILDQLAETGPEEAALWTARIATALDRDEPRRALDLWSAALDHAPADEIAAPVRAAVLGRAARDPAALPGLEALHRALPGDAQIAVALARGLRDAGRPAEATACLDDLLRTDPAHRPAHDLRLEIAEAAGDDAAAARVRADLRRRLPDPASGDAVSASGLLTLAEAGPGPGADETKGAITALTGRATELTDAELARLLALALRTEQAELAAAAIAAAQASPRIRPRLALALVELARNADGQALGDSLADALAPRIAAPARRAFRVGAARLLHGPAAAIEAARRPGAPRPKTEAIALGRHLLEAGPAERARRYLLRCRSRWPRNAAIATLLLTANLRCGRIDAARELADAAARDGLPRLAEDLALKRSMETGELEVAEAILRRHRDGGKGLSAGAALLRIHLSRGDLDAAEATEARLRAHPGQTAKAAAHFGAGHVGGLMTELKIYRQIAQGREGLPSADETRHHFFAAREVNDAWDGRTPAAGPASPVPPRIVQYWNRPEVPPALQDIMASWRDHPGWSYRLLDRRGAIHWLRATFGDDHVRAFRLANHVAEESDFLRLCLLLAEGGIYADADDRLLGRPDALLSFGPGLILFQEPIVGAMMNNLIGALPGHPVLRIAVDLAVTALIGRDNESTWSKTGPGLLTRAAATYRARDPDAAARDLTVVPRIRVHPLVHIHTALPYKKTPAYWNAGGARPPAGVAAALRTLAAQLAEGGGDAGRA